MASVLELANLSNMAYDSSKDTFQSWSIRARYGNPSGKGFYAELYQNSGRREAAFLTSATPSLEVEAVAAAAAEAGLGPDEQKQEEQKEEQPCIFRKYTVKCSHGREVTLDPASQEEGVVPRLAVVSISNESQKDIDKQEKITVKLDRDAPCGAHLKLKPLPDGERHPLPDSQGQG